MRNTLARRLLLTGAGSVALLVSPAQASRASKLAKLARQAQAQGDTARAFVYYSQAMAADPKKAAYRESAHSLAPELLAQADVKRPDFFLPTTQAGGLLQESAAPAGSGSGVATGANGVLGSAANGGSGGSILASSEPAGSERKPIDLSPEAVFDSITARELADERELLPAAQLQLPPGKQNFDFEGDAKTVFEQLATRLGLKIVFDNDFVPGHHVHFRLDQVGAREALHGLEAVTTSFVVPVGPRVILVAADTEPKRKELEQVETLSVPIPSVLTVQEITELGQAVKQAASIDKIYWDSQANQIVLRDRVSRVLAGESILHDLISYRGQVEVELEFIELSEAEMQQLGADLQTTFNLNFIGQLVQGNLTPTLTLAQLSKFSFSKMFGVGLVSADVIAQMTRAGARNLLRTTMVSVENQKATFHAGSKYPIITSQFVGAVNTGGQVYQPPPSFTFEDLGIVVNVTPHVHGNGEITLDLETEYKILGAASVNGLPIVSSRKMQSTIRLRGDQWAVVAGLTSESKSRAVSGPAFFSNVPLLGHIISHFTGNKANTYVIVSMKPHLLSITPDEKVTHPVYVGSDTRSITPL